MKKKYETSLVKNKTMSPQVYRLRQQVIQLIKEAGKLTPLPRITVRIAEKNHRYAGVGRMNQNIIWITEDFVANRGVVFHEILHAVFGVKHVPGCPLMSGEGTSASLSAAEVNRLFLKYVKDRSPIDSGDFILNY